MRAAATALGLMLVVAPSARAAEAEVLFRKGDFAAAMAAGRLEATPRGLNAAARASLVRAAFSTRTKEDALALVRQAERDAEAGLAKAGGDYDLTLTRAAAIGYRARLTSDQKLAKQARDLMRAAAEAKPDRPEAWLAIGSWNAEIVISVGGTLAGMMLGASKRGMEAAFERADKTSIKTLLVPASRGLLLARMGEEEAARAQLKQAIAAQPRDGYETLIRRHAAEVEDAFAQGGKREGRAAARRLAAFSQIG